MNDVIFGIAIIPLIVGLVQLFKNAALVPDRFAPLLSLALGVAGGILFVTAGVVGSVAEGVLLGIGFGLSASGLYSGTRAVIGG